MRTIASDTGNMLGQGDCANSKFSWEKDVDPNVLPAAWSILRWYDIFLPFLNI